MNTTVRITQPSSAPAPTFEQPFDMLEACHERVHRSLDLLARLRAHVVTHGADDQARQAAIDVLRYFDVAAPAHHLDEELHVFPPMLEHGCEATVAVVHRLQADHVQMDARWQAARPVLVALASGMRNSLDAAGNAALDAFAGLYAEHIRVEEEIAYPEVKALLDEATVAAMGEEMRRRRTA